jgi:HD superfamily phosphodiesterase
MDVFCLANNIYQDELQNDKQYLKTHENIIATSAILHDMCDKKYMNEEGGVKIIRDFLKDKISDLEIEQSLNIMSTMSYSTVKKNGFPQLGEYQLAYNIVREADLLASYDFDRAVMYNMYKNNETYTDSFYNSLDLFNKRVLRYNDDKLFTTRYAKLESIKLELHSIHKINNLVTYMRQLKTS